MRDYVVEEGTTDHLRCLVTERECARRIRQVPLREYGPQGEDMGIYTWKRCSYSFCIRHLGRLAVAPRRSQFRGSCSGDQMLSKAQF